MDPISNRADISRVLMQVRDMQAQLQDAAPKEINPELRLPGVGAPELRETRSDFGNLLKTAVDAVNETQMKSASLQRAYEMGEPGVDLTEVMIQMQKASVSFEAMTQVRNRLVSAYQDIMNMPI
jgi:flagellar hook-basal body complex protein FliE